MDFNINVQVSATDKSTASTCAGTTVRPSQRQYETLLTHMETHPQMSKVSKGSWSSADRRKSWELLAKTLNEDCGKGAVKTPEKWSKTFSDWKTTVKNKLKQMQSQPKGASAKVIVLNDLEKRLVKLMGWENLAEQQALANGLPGPSSAPQTNNPVNGSAESTKMQKQETSLPNIPQVNGGDDEFKQVKKFIDKEINESGQQNEINKMGFKKKNYESNSEDENYEPEFQDENFESDSQDENSESDYQDKNNESDHKDENYESDSQDEDYEPDRQNGNYVPPDQSRPSTLSPWEPCNYVPPNHIMTRRLPEMQRYKRCNYAPNHQDENNESDHQDENHVPDRQNRNYETGRRNGNYAPNRQNENYETGRQNGNYETGRQNGNYETGRQNGNYAPDRHDENNESDPEDENVPIRNEITHADIPTCRGETSRKRKRSSEDDRDDEISSVSLIKMFMESVTSIQTQLVKLMENQNQQSERFLSEVKLCRRSLKKLADKF